MLTLYIKQWCIFNWSAFHNSNKCNYTGFPKIVIFNRVPHFPLSYKVCFRSKRSQTRVGRTISFQCTLYVLGEIINTPCSAALIINWIVSKKWKASAIKFLICSRTEILLRDICTPLTDAKVATKFPMMYPDVDFRQHNLN